MKISIKMLLLFCFTCSVFCIHGQTIRLNIPSAKQIVFNGYSLDINWHTTIFGQSAGGSLTSGIENTFMGNQTGKAMSSGSYNTFYGSQAGLFSQGSSNVFIGYQAGMNEQGSNKLYISNSSTSQPLILGDFNANLLTIKGRIISDEMETAALTLDTTNPTVSFDVANNTKYQFGYINSGQKLAIKDNSLNINVLEIKNGDVYLPELAGSSQKNLKIDTDGKLVVADDIPAYTFNEYQFPPADSILNANLIIHGVQFPDGIELTGIQAYIKDNNTSGSNGVANTIFVGIYRKHKITPSTDQLIYRIDGSDTPTDTYELRTANILAFPGGNIIDNSNYIYFLKIYYCYDCGCIEATVLD